MDSLCEVLLSLAAVIAPLLLAWWLVARSSGGRARPRRISDSMKR